MHQLNNVDIVILILVGISALIGLSRGLVKEVLSITGWILATLAVIYLLPILNPIVSKYIMSGFVAGVVSALFILIAFLVIWILVTGQLVGKIRSSKLNGFDRFLGLFFGIARAFLLVILANILISWMIPREKQSPALTDSKYFSIAGAFAKPIEELIPAETLESIRKKAGDIGSDEETEEEKREKTEADLLFEKLAQPKLKKKKEEIKLETRKKVKETVKKLEKKEEKTPAKAAPALKETLDDGYDHSERQSLDNLIDSVH